MKVLVPMAGLGERFVRAGYKDPKPLIKVGGKEILKRIVEMFPSHASFVFICNEKHVKETTILEFLNSLGRKSDVVSIPCHKKGPVYTTSFAFDYIEDDEEIIVTYCDNPYLHDFKDFITSTRSRGLDGCILTHTGFHPHSLNSTKMAFLKEECGRVIEIKEKECYTDCHTDEHASTGTYFFARGKYVKKYFRQAINENLNHGGEHYVTLVYNLLIRDGLKVGFYDTPFVSVFGTPEEIQNFEAWQTIINGGQVKTTDDLLNSYEYWKKFLKEGDVYNAINIS